MSFKNFLNELKGRAVFVNEASCEPTFSPMKFHFSHQVCISLDIF